MKAPLSPLTPGPIFFKRTFPRKMNTFISCCNQWSRQYHRIAGGGSEGGGRSRLLLWRIPSPFQRNQQFRSLNTLAMVPSSVFILPVGLCAGPACCLVPHMFASEGDKAIISPTFSEIQYLCMFSRYRTGGEACAWSA